MRKSKSQFAAWLALLLLGTLAVPPAFSQGGFGGGQGKRAQRRAGRPPEKARKPGGKHGGAVKENPGKGNARAVMGLPPKWLERVQEMSPEQQERFMNNNARFQSLPPQRQQEIRERLRHWNSLTPDQRNALRDRQRVWEQMSPEQQEHIRNDLLPKWQHLPQDRKELLLGRLRNLRGMSDSERAAKLNDEEFLRGLSSDERDMLRDLNTLRNPPTP